MSNKVKITQWKNHKFKTVYILGAGASHDYRFPTGLELKNFVLGQLDIDQDFIDITKQANQCLDWLEEFGDFSNSFKDFQRALRGSSAPTIDTFISRNRSHLAMGQFITAFSLARWSSYGLTQPKDKWIGYYLNKRISSQLNEYIKKPDCFITFNYDNSLEEEFLKFFSNQEIDSTIKSEAKKYSYNILPIFHVYGSLGESLTSVRNQLNTSNAENIKFNSVYSLSKNIRFIDRDQDKAESEFYRDILAKAEEIIILGYGFDPDNNDLIFGGRAGLNNNIRNAEIYATAKGFSAQEIEKLTLLRYPDSYDHIKNNDNSPTTNIEDLTCLELLMKYTFARKFFNDE